MNQAARPIIYFLSFVGANYSRSSTILNSNSEILNKRYLQVNPGFFGIIRSISKKRQELGGASAIVVMSPCQMIAPIVKLVLRKPVILDAGWSLTDGNLSRGITKANFLRSLSIFILDFLSFHVADLILLETTSQLKRSRKLFLLSKRKSSVQYTGFDESHFKFVEPKSQMIEDVENILKARNRPLTVIFRGKVNNESGFALILETARKMRDFATFIFVLGMEHQKLDVPENVLLTRGVTNSEMHYLYEFADVALGQVSDHPRLRYTIPHKAFEAGYFSKSYITSNAVGIRELFDENSALFLPECNPDSLEAAIKSLHTKEARDFYSKNIREVYNEKASQGQISASFDQLVIKFLFHCSK